MNDMPIDICRRFWCLVRSTNLHAHCAFACAWGHVHETYNLIFDPPLLVLMFFMTVTHSYQYSRLLLWYPPPPLSADIICTSPLAGPPPPRRCALVDTIRVTSDPL